MRRFCFFFFCAVKNGLKKKKDKDTKGEQHCRHAIRQVKEQKTKEQAKWKAAHSHTHTQIKDIDQHSVKQKKKKTWKAKTHFNAV